MIKIDIHHIHLASAGIIPTFILPALFVSFAYLKLSQAYIRCGRDVSPGLTFPVCC